MLEHKDCRPLGAFPTQCKRSGIDARTRVLNVGGVSGKGGGNGTSRNDILDNGEPLPVVSMDTVAHGRLALPDAFGDGWGVLLLYRAHW